jgi:hypothetical protein
LYDIAIKKFIDDEVQDWNRLSLCWVRGWIAMAWAFVWSLSWVENFNKTRKIPHFYSRVIFSYM